MFGRKKVAKIEYPEKLKEALGWIPYQKGECALTDKEIRDILASEGFGGVQDDDITYIRMWLADDFKDILNKMKEK